MGVSGNNTVLSCFDLFKSFGATVAVDNVTFSLRKGDILGLVGENGAGKSTLIKLCGGELTPDQGRTVYKGSEIRWSDSYHALTSGIGMVHQAPLIVPELTALENIFLGHESTRAAGTLLDDGETRERARVLLAEYPIWPDLSLDEKVMNMSPGQRTLIETLRVLSYDPEVLLLDEPTAGLSQSETEAFLSIMRQLNTEKRLSMIFISHKLEETIGICDQIMVMRNGTKVGTLQREDFDRSRIVQMMINEELSEFYPEKAEETGRPLLKVDDLRSGDIRGVSLTVNEGEIVGLYGLVGAGMKGVLESIFTPKRISRAPLAKSLITSLFHYHLKWSSTNIRSLTSSSAQEILHSSISMLCRRLQP
jgi:ABC-type sugar transport system ATPase subunit